MTDPIADLLTRVRNAYAARHSTLRVAHSEMKYSILKIMEKYKYVESISVEDLGNNKKVINVTITERGIDDVYPSFQRKSKPGQRLYITADNIKPVNNGYGIAIVSTSKGLMTGYEAKKAGLGGEYICEIY